MRLPRFGPAAPGWSGELVLVRHGQTGCTVEGSFCGSHDPPLTAAGRLMADRLADAEPLADVRRLFASPSLRSLDTCRPLAARRELVACADPRLRELDFGAWEQRLPAELPADGGHREWQNDPAGHAPPGGENGLAVLARTIAATREALAGGDTVALVSHKAPIRLLVCFLLGVAPRRYREIPLPVGSITRLSLGTGRPELVCLGDVAHLPAGWRADPDHAAG
ncbi:MAG: histidine phosphatase family protein [Jatrophihabitans sp.]